MHGCNRQGAGSSAEMSTEQQLGSGLMMMLAEFRCEILQHMPGNFVIVGLTKVFR